MIKSNRVWIMVLSILLFFFLAISSLVDDSPTMDEQNHLARGLAFLYTGDPRFSLEHPPFINTLSALPLLTLPTIRLPIDDISWEQLEGWYRFADLLLWEYNHDVTRMIFLARIPIVFLTIGLALIGYRFTQELWRNSGASTVAFLMLLFSPNIMAHGRYATTDIGGTVFVFLATWALWRLWQYKNWNWSQWVLATLSLGLAFGSKLSTLTFIPIWFLLATLPLYGHSLKHHADKHVARRILQLASAGFFSMFVLWAVYGFEWGTFYFQSNHLSYFNKFHGPMPTFWAGIEQILKLSGEGRGNTFLLGQFSDKGFPTYFPVAFISKTPLSILLLLPFAIIFLLTRKETRTRASFLLLPIVIFFFFAIQSTLNIGYRHLLPITPFLIVLISGLHKIPNNNNRAHIPTCLYQTLSFSAIKFALYVSVLSLVISNLLIYPYYLSYFNGAVGGPQNGYKILVDSNIDWGQDLLRLKQWMDTNNVTEIKLTWFGSANPSYYNIKYHPLPGIGREEFFRLWWDVPFDPANPEPGVYAISVSNLWELPLQENEKGIFSWFRHHQPDSRVGYSILIYNIP